jgi:hypothetical protein
MRCCADDGGVVALRRRPAGEASIHLKPKRCDERCQRHGASPCPTFSDDSGDDNAGSNSAPSAPCESWSWRSLKAGEQGCVLLGVRWSRGSGPHPVICDRRRYATSVPAASASVKPFFERFYTSDRLVDPGFADGAALD